MQGECFECVDASCWKDFWLCIKCIKYKDVIHPSHSFEKFGADEHEARDGDEAELTLAPENEKGEEQERHDEDGKESSPED